MTNYSRKTGKQPKASNLKRGQLLFVKDHQKGTFGLSYVYDLRVIGILNDSNVVLTTPDGKETSITSNQ